MGLAGFAARDFTGAGFLLLTLRVILRTGTFVLEMDLVLDLDLTADFFAARAMIVPSCTEDLHLSYGARRAGAMCASITVARGVLGSGVSGTDLNARPVAAAQVQKIMTKKFKGVGEDQEFRARRLPAERPGFRPVLFHRLLKTENDEARIPVSPTPLSSTETGGLCGYACASLCLCAPISMTQSSTVF
jgi:hypothetical protein